MDDSSEDGEDRFQVNATTAEDYQIPVDESVLKSILSTIDDAVFIFSVDHDDDGVSFTFRWNNPAHESITGMTIDEHAGLRPAEFLGEKQGREVTSKYRECVERRAPIEYEETLEHEHGEVTWQTKLIPIVTEDTVVQVIGMSRDVTELVERTTHLDVVDRVLRHNIRNRLNLIRGRARRIEAETDSPTSGGAARIIEASNDLLATAEKARTITEVVIGDHSVTRLQVGDLLTQITSRLPEGPTEATISTSVDQSVTLVASPWLADAVVELVHNAVKHNDKPDPVVELSVTANEYIVEFDVVDDGPGIPESEREILQRGRSPTGVAHGGGLGTWMVYWIVHQSGGEVLVSDRTPRGSAVTIRIPQIVEN